MKLVNFLFVSLLASVTAFVPASRPTSFIARDFSSSLSMAKYNTMEEILAKFPEDIPTLINFYDAATEADIKGDILRAKNLLKDRCSFVSIKQQDYPEIAKSWDCAEKSPSMILFKDGKPVSRLYEETFYLDIVAKFGKYCRPAGEEFVEQK